MAAGAAAPHPFPPLPLLPGQLPRVRSVWTRQVLVVGVVAATLIPWLLVHLAFGVYFLRDTVGPDWAPEQRAAAWVYLGYVIARPTVAAGIALDCWRRSRGLRRTGGRPTRRGAAIVTGYAVLTAVLAVDAFTFGLIRMWEPSAF